MDDQGDQIDVLRGITVAAREVGLVDGALRALGAGSSREDIWLYGLASLDAPSVAEYLRKSAANLQSAATDLAYLADHADLSPLVAQLQAAENRNFDGRTVDGLTVDEMLDLLADGGD
jgi:hypothetical protein